jgi:hypothetical protein
MRWRTTGPSNTLPTSCYERAFGRRNAMFTSAECRVKAEQKLEQAKRDDRHRKRLITAAEAWLILASQMRRLEAQLRSSDARP